MSEIRKEWERFSIVRYDYGYVSDIPTEQIGKADTLADAIRSAGIRCETCKHFGRNLGSYIFGPNPRHECDLLQPDSNPEHPAIMSVMPDWFCGDHSRFNDPQTKEE